MGAPKEIVQKLNLRDEHVTGKKVPVVVEVIHGLLSRLYDSRQWGGRYASGL